jgi:predicted dehydrogenase
LVVGTEIRIGALGVGNFGRFALQNFVQLPGVSIVAIAETGRESAMAVSERFNVPDVQRVDALIGREDVDLVYIATPPFLHHPYAKDALSAGKHVILEKPLALTLQQADELMSLAADRDLVLVANLMQPYNPLFEMVTELVRNKLLGEVLYGYFENYASDEHLSPDHWFWDRKKSGGIFIEHGVHFFDMFETWIGPGEVVAAQRVLRPGTKLEEQVACTVRHEGGALVHHYHGFTQPSRSDRQEIRLLFELGQLTLRGWVPLTAKVRALVDDNRWRQLAESFPGSQTETLERFREEEQEMMARHRQRTATRLVELSWRSPMPKFERYGQLVRSLIADQIRWIGDHRHRRSMTAEKGRASLGMALQATHLAGGDSQPARGLLG